jgi:hypothetical protein
MTARPTDTDPSARVYACVFVVGLEEKEKERERGGRGDCVHNTTIYPPIYLGEDRPAGRQAGTVHC